MNLPASGTPALGEFLRARRSALTPRMMGLPETESQRRVSGLRREEVAQLASISVDYYTRLEQGRVAASASVLAILARALQLDEDQRAYLYELAGKASTLPRRSRTESMRPAMRRLLEQLSESPALVLGRRMDILAWNTAASALFLDFERVPNAHRDYVRLLFTEPDMRALHVDWDAAAETAVASLRMEAARNPGDSRLAALVGELSVSDTPFRRWWAAHTASTATYGTKHYRHPLVGRLDLDCDIWTSPDGSEQRLMVLTAEPGTPSHEALRFLASWAAQPGHLQDRTGSPASIDE
jgi:transcriptional regulator with XRE-family HTH domain